MMLRRTFLGLAALAPLASLFPSVATGPEGGSLGELVDGYPESIEEIQFIAPAGEFLILSDSLNLRRDDQLFYRYELVLFEEAPLYLFGSYPPRLFAPSRRAVVTIKTQSNLGKAGGFYSPASEWAMTNDQDGWRFGKHTIVDVRLVAA